VHIGDQDINKLILNERSEPYQQGIKNLFIYFFYNCWISMLMALYEVKKNSVVIG